jgi:hypothetical protein
MSKSEIIARYLRGNRWSGFSSKPLHLRLLSRGSKSNTISSAITSRYWKDRESWSGKSLISVSEQQRIARDLHDGVIALEASDGALSLRVNETGLDSSRPVLKEKGWD